MINVSIKQLVSVIAEVDVFKLPEMNEGTKYLYDKLYRRLAQNIDVRLSELDFDAFEDEDLKSLNDLHTNVFEQNNYTADGIISTLRRVTPVYRTVDYI